MGLLVVVVCKSNPGRFVVLVSGLLCLGIETKKFSPLCPFRPMPLNYTIRPFSRAFWHLFSHPIRCSWFCASLFFLCASVSPVISTSKIGFGGSTNSGLSRNRFRTSIPSFANTAISIIAAHLDRSKGGSAEAISQKWVDATCFFYESC